MFKKFFVFLKIGGFLAALFFCFLSLRGLSAQTKTELYFFYGEGCPHCAREEKFLSQLEKENKDLQIYRYEVWSNKENAQLFAELIKKLNLDRVTVPVLIIGNEAVIGYNDDQSTGQKIKAVIEERLAGGSEEVKPQEKISLPFFGEINIKKLSLPLLTIIIGALDGFNPCAMWALLFLISLLLGMENKSKRWILGSAFIFSSAFVYFLFLSAWLNIFLFLKVVSWIKIVIGIVALASGGYQLRNWWVNRQGGCAVLDNEKRKKTFSKLRNIIGQKKFAAALAGIIILAAAVNLVELVCSAGLPAIYTQALALADLPVWKYYLYLLLYIFIFMLDDLLIFVIAMVTLEIKAVSARYTRWAGLVGGLIMAVIGLLLLFKPAWLMFG